MLRARVIVAAALSVFTVACAEPPKRANPVGLSFAAYADTARRSWTGPEDRPLATAVWYPAAPGSRESEWRVGIFNAGWNARKAPLSAATAKRPLIVLSHGTGGGAAGMAWLAETLASNGYIVAAVNHHGNTAAEPSYQLQGFMLWWDRARDISKDDRALPDVNARPIASAIPNAELEIIPNVAHYTFLARCNLLGKVVARSLCTDPDDTDREDVHRRVSADALKFFDRTVRMAASE
jgi:predicted dienelactone hydrolase